MLPLHIAVKKVKRSEKVSEGVLSRFSLDSEGMKGGLKESLLGRVPTNQLGRPVGCFHDTHLKNLCPFVHSLVCQSIR